MRRREARSDWEKFLDRTQEGRNIAMGVFMFLVHVQAIFMIFTEYVKPNLSAWPQVGFYLVGLAIGILKLVLIMKFSKNHENVTKSFAIFSLAWSTILIIVNLSIKFN